MNVKQSSRYLRRRLVRQLNMGYASIATWIPQRFPDFMCIGAPRAATTWMHKQLSADPSIFLPKRKEIHFYDETPDAAGADDSELRWSDSFYFDVDKPSHQRWYWYQFRHAAAKQAGDITPLYSTLSAERIRTVYSHNPDLKIVYILRNPVDRAWSGVRKSVWYQKGTTYLDDKDEEWLLKQVMRPEVLVRGNYPQAITNWESVFPEAQILYLFHDDIEEDDRKVLGKIYEFLGLDLAEQKPAQARTARVNAAPEKAMPASVKAALLEHYAPQITTLEAKFGRDLSSWRN